MITREQILEDLTDWKNGKMGYRALIDAIDRYAESKQLHKPNVMVELPEIHRCKYSKAMNEPRPRLCVECGKPEGN